MSITKDDRLNSIITELLIRAEHCEGNPSLSTTEIYDSVLDAEVSRKSCRNYLDELAERPGLEKTKEETGGWGGGSKPMHLVMNVQTFAKEHSTEEFRFVDSDRLDGITEI